MQKYACFNCNKQGHFAKDCPSKSPKKSPPSVLGGSTSSGPDHPVIQCRCGSGPCQILVSRTEKNPGRMFYTCPIPGARKCGFFKWCADVKDIDINFSPQMTFPKCDCGAGICRKYKETRGPNAGRSYFVCPIKRGHGACKFFQWENIQACTIVNNYKDESQDYGSPQSMCDSHGIFDIASNDLHNSDAFSFEQTRRQVDDPKSMFMPIFSAQDNVMLTENQESGRTMNILSTNQHNPSQFASVDESSAPNLATSNLVMQEAESWDSMVEKTAVVHFKSQSGVPCQHMEFWRKISAAVYTSHKDIIYESLGFHMLGWLGRLAFPPSRCLTDRPPAPYFCVIFPSFDPICIPQYRDRLHSEGSTALSRHLSNADVTKLSGSVSGEDLQLPDGILRKPSGLKRSSTMMDETGTSKMINFFEQTASIVKQLSTVLNSIDQSNHDSMTRAASKVFSVINGMSIDNNPVNGCVKEFVDSALRLDAIEQSACDEHSREQLIDAYNEEKVRFDSMTRAHEEAVADLMASSKHLQSLHKEASRVRDVLAEIENQLSSCEAETSELKNRVDLISRDMLESKSSMEKAEEALKLCEQREEERLAAKAALEKISQSRKQACKFHFWKRRKVELLQ